MLFGGVDVCIFFVALEVELEIVPRIFAENLPLHISRFTGIDWILDVRKAKKIRIV